MSSDIKKILQSFDKILNENKPFVNEAAINSPLDQTSVNSGFGARWGTTHNGVDLTANAANVKSPADGVVEVAAIKNDDCGGTIIINQAGGFKTGFCHLQKINVRPGQNIKQGDIIAISGGGKDDVGHGRSDGRHLHFTLRKDGNLVNPIDYIDKSGVIMTGGNPQSSSGDTGSKSTTTGNLTIDTGKLTSVPSDIANLTNALNPASALKSALKEQSYRGKEKFYLQFCNVSNPMVRNGQQISTNSVLGKTDTDVEVSKYDSSRSRVNLKKGTLNFGKNIKENLGNIIIPKDYNQKIISPVSGIINNSRSNQSCNNQITIEYYVGEDEKKPDNRRTTEPRFTDPLLGAILTAPLKIFQDKYDKDTGELKQKRFGHPGERVDPWIKDAIVAPFKKIGNLFRKENKEEEERKKKKVTENIEKIKKLLK